MWKRIMLGISVVVLVLVLWCGWGVYRSGLRPSAIEQIHRLAGMPPGSSPEIRAIRAGLLRQVPVQTAATDVIVFLDQQGAMFHNHADSDRRRLDPDYPVQCHFDGHVAIVCGVDGNEGIGPCDIRYLVRFLMDAELRVHDILVEDDSKCL